VLNMSNMLSWTELRTLLVGIWWWCLVMYFSTVRGLKIKNKYHVFICFVYCSKHRDVVWKFVIIVTSLHRDYLPSSWTIFTNVCWYRDFIGTIGFFFYYFYYSRTFPVIASRLKRYWKEQEIIT
jgi:molybdopterin-containing oxidoreductase family membrane subunit